MIPLTVDSELGYRRAMHVHLIGVCGTGMGSLAGLLRDAGHRVTGSDTAFYPPMGDALARWGVETKTGYDPAHLEPAPDLVIVGNVCRPTNVEARAAIDRGLKYMSMPAALEALFLEPCRSFVIAGTHGKTTTSTLATYLLDRAGAEPGFLIGGIPQDFDESFRIGKPKRPFVIEGDEYDSAFFEKRAKFLRYRPEVVVLNAIEHDHIDIYPDMASYRAAFDALVDLIPVNGKLIAYAGDAEVRRVASRARCEVSYFALDGDDCGDVSPQWLAAKVASDGEMQPFDLFFGGSSCGRVNSPLSGDHNLRNALAAIAMSAEGAGIAVRTLVGLLPAFRGVRRRQQLIGIANGVRVYDDFAHHPTAVNETVRGLRERHPNGRLIAVFEPRSATASRKLHQAEYVSAFARADVTLLAPVGRSEIAESERLDVHQLAAAIAARGTIARALGSAQSIADHIAEIARPGDTVVAMSNGAFDNIHERILGAIGARLLATQRHG